MRPACGFKRGSFLGAGRPSLNIGPLISFSYSPSFFSAIANPFISSLENLFFIISHRELEWEGGKTPRTGRERE